VEILISRFRKTHSFSQKSGTHWVLGVHWIFGFIGLLDFLFELVVGKLVGWFSSSALLLFRFVSTLDYLKIRKFITYWSLEAVNIKKSLTITGMTNWNWTKFSAGSLLGLFSTGYTSKKHGGFSEYYPGSEPCLILKNANWKSSRCKVSKARQARLGWKINSPGVEIKLFKELD